MSDKCLFEKEGEPILTRNFNKYFESIKDLNDEELGV